MSRLTELIEACENIVDGSGTKRDAIEVANVALNIFTHIEEFINKTEADNIEDMLDYCSMFDNESENREQSVALDRNDTFLYFHLAGYTANHFQQTSNE